MPRVKQGSVYEAIDQLGQRVAGLVEQYLQSEYVWLVRWCSLVRLSTSTRPVPPEDWARLPALLLWGLCLCWPRHKPSQPSLPLYVRQGMEAQRMKDSLKSAMLVSKAGNAFFQVGPRDGMSCMPDHACFALLLSGSCGRQPPGFKNPTARLAPRPRACRRLRSGWPTSPTGMRRRLTSPPVAAWSCCWPPCWSHSCRPSPPPRFPSWGSTRWARGVVMGGGMLTACMAVTMTREFPDVKCVLLFLCTSTCTGAAVGQRDRGEQPQPSHHPASRTRPGLGGGAPVPQDHRGGGGGPEGQVG